jgi:hypothetical protein
MKKCYTAAMKHTFFTKLKLISIIIGITLVFIQPTADAAKKKNEPNWFQIMRSHLRSIEKSKKQTTEKPVIAPVIKPMITPMITPVPPSYTPPKIPQTPAIIPSPSNSLDNAIFYWHTAELFANPDPIIEKIAKADIGGGQIIRNIYLNFSSSAFTSAPEKYKNVIDKFHAKGWKVYALMGGNDWATPAKWTDTETRYVKTFNAYPIFDGVIFDIEPWANPSEETRTWWESSNAPFDYASFLYKWRQALPQDKKILVTIANWHDVHKQANQKEFLKQIYSSSADTVVIMDYSTSDYISRIATEMGYSKPTIIAFETHIQPGVDTTIGFDSLNAVQKAVVETLKTYPNIRGFAMHDEEYLRFYK